MSSSARDEDVRRTPTRGPRGGRRECVGVARRHALDRPGGRRVVRPSRAGRSLTRICLARPADEFEPGPRPVFRGPHRWEIAREIRRFLNRPDATHRRAEPPPSPPGDPIGGEGSKRARGTSDPNPEVDHGAIRFQSARGCRASEEANFGCYRPAQWLISTQSLEALEEAVNEMRARKGTPIEEMFDEMRQILARKKRGFPRPEK